MARKAKKQRLTHNKKTSGRKANAATKKNASKNSTSTQRNKPSKAKIAEKEARREEKIAAVEAKEKTKDTFKKVGIIVVCVILVVALGLPATIFAFGGKQTAVEDTTTKTVSKTLSKQQHQFFDDIGMFDNFLLVDKDTGVTLTDICGGATTPEVLAVINDIEQSGDTPASRLILPDNMTFAD